MKRIIKLCCLLMAVILLSSCGQKNTVNENKNDNTFNKEDENLSDGISDVPESNPVAEPTENEDNEDIDQTENQTSEDTNIEDTNIEDTNIEDLDAKDTDTEDTNAEATDTNIEEQLQLMVDNISLWKGDLEGQLYGYAVTDLDQNGRLEIISSSTQGTGIYTTSYFFEVNESSDQLVPIERTLEEGNSEADIMVASVPIYYDSNNNIYHYIFDDLIKNGATEYYENKRALSLQNGQMIEEFLVNKSTIYTNSDPAITYTDTVNGSDQKEITEDEYNNIADSKFADLDKKSANIQWVTNTIEELDAMDEATVYEILIGSYEGFSIQ